MAELLPKANEGNKKQKSSRQLRRKKIKVPNPLLCNRTSGGYEIWTGCSSNLDLDLVRWGLGVVNFKGNLSGFMGLTR